MSLFTVPRNDPRSLPLYADEMISVMFTDTIAVVTWDIPSPFAPPVKHTVHIPVSEADWTPLLAQIQGVIDALKVLTHEEAVATALHLTPPEKAPR